MLLLFCIYSRRFIYSFFIVEGKECISSSDISVSDIILVTKVRPGAVVDSGCGISGNCLCLLVVSFSWSLL